GVPDGDHRGAGEVPVGPGAGGVVHGAVLPRVLGGDEDGLVVGGDEGAAALGADRDGGEGLEFAAVAPLDRHHVQGVVDAQGAGLAVGGDPQVAGLVEGHVVGRGDRGDPGLVVSGVVGAGVLGVAADRHHGPGEGGGPGVVAVLGDLQDVAVPVGGARVGLVGLAGLAGGVVGEGAVHLAGGGAGLDVLGAVHL